MNTDCNSDEYRRDIFLKIHKIYIHLYAIEIIKCFDVYKNQRESYFSVNCTLR